LSIARSGARMIATVLAVLFEEFASLPPLIHAVLVTDGYAAPATDTVSASDCMLPPAFTAVLFVAVTTRVAAL
jgi:hypothetical protein